MRKQYPDGDRKAWLREEWSAIEAAAQPLGPIPHAIVLWTYETASRITETLHARWADIDFHEQTVTIDRLKGSETKLALPVSDELVAALAKLERPGDALFPGVTKCIDVAPKERRYEVAANKCHGHLSQRYAFECFRRACRAVTGLHPGLQHPHAAKHTRLYDMAEDLAAAGYPAHEIFDWLRQLSGHKSYDNLHIYLRSRQQAAQVLAHIRRGLRRDHGTVPVVLPARIGRHHGEDAVSNGAPSAPGPATLGLPHRDDRRLDGRDADTKPERRSRVHR